MMILMNGIGQRLIFRAQPEVEKEKNKKSCKLQAASCKHQASSLTMILGYSRITKKVGNNETNNNI